MKKAKRFSLIIAVVLVLAMLVTSCKKSPAPAANDNKNGDSSTQEAYTFTHYWNYDYWTIHEWGKDAVSAELQKKFNVNVDFSKPDSDAQAKLNIMISSGDLPDSIMMDRGTDNIKMAKLGLFQDLAPLMEKNPNMKNNLLPSTLELLKIDGKLYGIPNWARKDTSGGNKVYIYNTKLWEAAGSPKLDTFEDLYAYAKKIKTDVPKTADGQPTIPLMFTNSGDGWELLNGFTRNFGGYVNGWYAVTGGKYTVAFRNPIVKTATMELNKWWREGLIDESVFTETGDQVTEKLTAGRGALLFYDQSSDESTHFRRILREKQPGNSYEVVQPNIYPPANGLDASKTYGDIQGTIGWNVTCITTKAKNPQRIFDLWTYLLTPEAAVLQEYGPKGGFWDTLDSNGIPELKKPESEFTTDEINKAGTWFWMCPGQSDNVDKLKFAVNSKQPKDKQNWVATNQEKLITPNMKLSDEFVGIADTIDGQSDLGIKRTTCEDYIKAQYPKIIMAKSADEAEKLYNDLVSFLDKNGMPEIEATYDKKYQENVKTYGTVFK